MRLEDFLLNKDVPLPIRVGTLLASGDSLGDVNFIIHAEFLLEEFGRKKDDDSLKLFERLLKAKKNRKLKISKGSKN